MCLLSAHPLFALSGLQFFFDGHVILAKFFKAPVHLVDDTMKALLDIATPAQFVEAFLDDASSGFAFSRSLPGKFGECLHVAQIAWLVHCRTSRAAPPLRCEATLRQKSCTGEVVSGHVQTPKVGHRNSCKTTPPLGERRQTRVAWTLKPHGVLCAVFLNSYYIMDSR